MKKMKKIIGIFVLAVAVYLGLLFTAEMAKADVLYDLEFDKKYEIAKRTYVYRFNVTLDKSGRVFYKMIADNANDYTSITVYDENEIEVDAIGSPRGSFNKYSDLKAGTYTFKFERRGSAGDHPSSGILSMSFEAAEETYPEDAIETNNNYGAASELESIKNETINGQLAANDTVDFYTFEVQKATKLTFTFKSALSVEMHIFNEDLDYEVKKTLQAGTNKVTENFPEGVYYVSFKNVKTSVTGTYSLKLKTSDFKKTSINSVKSIAKKTLKATWKKVSGVHGYEVQIATNSKFTKGKKTYDVTTTNKTIKKLKSKKTYYVRVRTYVKAANGEKCYSAWSKSKKVKIK